MPQSTSITYEAYTPSNFWRSPVRVLHWVIATSLAGATFLTSQGEIGHITLGWIALGGLSIQLLGLENIYPSGLVLWLVTAGVAALSISGALAADSTFHLGATLIVLVVTAFYCATVLFELLQLVAVRVLATEYTH
jgi:hypothetical protein